MALQVWLPFDGNLENRGLSHIDIVNNGATISTDGKIGSCYAFSSANMSYNWNFGSSTLYELSICCWVKPVNGNITNLFGINYGSYWQFTIGSSNKLSVRDNLGGKTGTRHEYSIGDITSGKWIHICCTYDHGTVKIYKDGVLYSTNTTGGSYLNPEINTFWIGQSQASNYFTGSINDFRIYNHCLSNKEVREISQALVLHYKLDSIKNNILPPGIELYESIQGDGSSWINTLVPYNSSKNTYKIKCKFSQPTYQYNYDPIFSAYTDENHKCLRIIRGANNNKMWVQYNTSPNSGTNYRIEFTTDNSNIREVTITSSTVTLLENGTTTTYNVPVGTGSKLQTTFRLLSSSDTQVNKAKSVIYYWTIWDGDTMLGNFVPATYFGKKGMWDTVTGKFFGNDGEGDFIMGNKIIIKEYEYLQCDTSSYIKSGVFPTTSTNFEMKYAANTVSTENVFFGCSTVVSYVNGNNFSMDILSNRSLLYTFKNKGHYASPYKATANTPFITKLYGSTFTVNDISMLTDRHTSHPNLEIYLFARNVNNAIHSSYPPRVGKIYYCKFWENDTLIRDFVPVSYNDTLGLFDKVELKFYPNAGTGTFTAGTLISEIVEDCSGYGHDGVVTGTIQTTNNTSRYNTSLMITDGLENYIKSPLIRTDSKAITMNIWIKSNGTAPTGGFHMPFEAKNGAHREMSIGSTGYLRGGLHIGGTRYVANTPSSSAVLTDGNWHMITLTYNGATIKRYIDAKMLSSTAVTGSLTTPEIEYYFGRYGTSTSYCCKDMQLSDARIYATALSADDIIQLYKTSASVDNLGNLHTFEIIETNEENPNVKRNGQFRINEFIEPYDYIYLPSGRFVNVGLAYAKNDVCTAKTIIRYEAGGSTRDLMGYSANGGGYWGVTAAGAWEPHGTFTYTNSDITVKNNIYYSFSGSNDQGTYTVGDINRSVSGTGSYSTRAKYIYHVTLYKNGTLERDLYPITYDGIPGLYDILHEVFYPCNNTSGVLVGDDSDIKTCSLFNKKIETNHIIEI